MSARWRQFGFGDHGLRVCHPAIDHLLGDVRGLRQERVEEVQGDLASVNDGDADLNELRFDPLGPFHDLVESSTDLPEIECERASGQGDGGIELFEHVQNGDEPIGRLPLRELASSETAPAKRQDVLTAQGKDRRDVEQAITDGDEY